MNTPPLTRPLAVALATLLAPAVSHAAAISGTIYEGFDYTTTDNPGDNTADGDIAANNGGTGFGGVTTWGTASGGTGTNTVLNVATPGLTYTGLVTTGNALNLNAVAPVGGTANSTQSYFRPLGQTIDTGSLYFSILLRKDVDTQRTINFALFGGGGEHLTVGQFSPASTFSNGNIGMVQNNLTPVPLVGAAIPLNLGATYLLVGRVDFNVDPSGPNPTFDRLVLYVNPTPGAAEPVGSEYINNTGFNIGTIDQMRPFAGNTASPYNAANATFDEARFGSTFESVTPIPEPGSFALLGLAAGGLMMRRRRA